MVSGGVLKVCSKFLALRAKVKMYEVYNTESKEFQNSFTLKGIKKAVVKNELQPKKWKDALFENKDAYVTQHSLRGFNHTYKFIEQKKKALSNKDDKRIWNKDGVTSLPIGYDFQEIKEKKTEEMEE